MELGKSMDFAQINCLALQNFDEFHGFPKSIKKIINKFSYFLSFIIFNYKFNYI